MINQDIITYIKTETQRGIDRQSITEELLASGWKTEDIEEAYQAVDADPEDMKESYWKNRIPKLNKTFLIINIIFVFGIDLLILVLVPDLLGYWLIMLAVFAVFVVFGLLENRILKDRFSNSNFDIDKAIVVLITIRNIILLMNFIPLIQLLGLMFGFVVVWIYVPLYIILVSIRYVRTKKFVQG